MAVGRSGSRAALPVRGLLAAIDRDYRRQRLYSCIVAPYPLSPLWKSCLTCLREAGAVLAYQTRPHHFSRKTRTHPTRVRIYAALSYRARHSCSGLALAQSQPRPVSYTALRAYAQFGGGCVALILTSTGVRTHHWCLRYRVGGQPLAVLFGG